VYSLCDVLPISMSNNSHLNPNQFVSVYPNPSTGQITFQLSPPSSFDQYELVVFTETMEVVKSEKFIGNKTIQLSNLNLANGNYFFSVQSALNILQTGKFIITH
jgi:hypothetical protein